MVGDLPAGGVAGWRAWLLDHGAMLSDLIRTVERPNAAANCRPSTRCEIGDRGPVHLRRHRPPSPPMLDLLAARPPRWAGRHRHRRAGQPGGGGDRTSKETPGTASVGSAGSAGSAGSPGAQAWSSRRTGATAALRHAYGSVGKRLDLQPRASLMKNQAMSAPGPPPRSDPGIAAESTGRTPIDSVARPDSTGETPGW